LAAAAMRAPAPLLRFLPAAPGLLLALVLFTVPVAQAEPDAGGWSYELAHELMSPYCPGRTLAECPSEKADTLRMWLHVQEASGRPVDEVKAELVERFGDTVLSAPRPEGFGLAAYFLPVLAFLAGGLLVAHFLRKQTREAATRSGEAVAPPRAAAAPTTPVDPELERLVDEELSR
jgi:cytochrome c-type biogenesis protein CcmH